MISWLDRQIKTQKQAPSVITWLDKHINARKQAPSGLALHIQEPNSEGYDFYYRTPDSSEYFLGRSTAECSFQQLQIQLHDPHVSRLHCRFFRLPHGLWMVEDLNSSNGTFLGRQEKGFIPAGRVRRPMPIRPGVTIFVGKTILTVRSTEAVRTPFWKFRAA
ncbi:MAG: FHA domain-containing protein [Magnetococcales bacterium]|nr:FHA domain-containing protein [Magnetococcales bacterium]